MGARDEVQVRDRAGSQLGGRYTLTRALGAGGMATVYEALHRNGHRVAIKLQHAALAGSESQRLRFRREAYLANRIDHPGVVRIFDDGETSDGTPYLVLELLRGRSAAALAAAHEGERLPLPEILDLADQLLSVLTAAHAAGVIHRDLKPDNLFVQDDGSLKVLDFGIARVLGQAALDAGTPTQHGAVLGTPAFMAQEQARGRWDLVDQRTDLWAVGATLFTLLAGETVHAGGTPNEQLGRAMTLPARSLVALRPDLPAQLIALVERALEFEPSRRWPSARAMRAALRTACPDHPFREPMAEAPDVPIEAAAQAIDDPGVVTELPSQGDERWASTERGLVRKARSGRALAAGAGGLVVVALLVLLVLLARGGAEPARDSMHTAAVAAPPAAAPAASAPRPALPSATRAPAAAAPPSAAVPSMDGARGPAPRGRLAARGSTAVIQGAGDAALERRTPRSHVEPDDPFDSRL